MNESKTHDEQVAALQDRLWDPQGRVDDTAAPHIDALVDLLVSTKSPRAALLLGLLAEGDADPETRGAVRDRIRRGLPKYLALLDEHRGDRDPLFLALVYLVAHFHDARAQILEHARKDDDDWTRLDRILAFQDASGPDVAAHLRRLMPAGTAGPTDRAWRTIVASVLAPLGAEATDAILRAEGDAR